MFRIRVLTATVIADSLDGARLNMPNDLDIDGRGRVYFSDPNYSAEPNNLPHGIGLLGGAYFRWQLDGDTGDV